MKLLKINKINVSVESFGYLPTENLLKQLALYIDTVIISDPIFKHTVEKSKLHDTMSEFMKLDKLDFINRKQLASDAKYMKDTTNLVVSQFVKYLPVNLVNEPSKDLPVYYSENNFSDSLPPKIYSYFYQKANVNNVQTNDGLMSFSKNRKDLSLGTRIHVGFNDSISKGMIFQFFYNGKMGRYIPETISENEFNTWVKQSINRAAIHSYTQTFNELIFSKKVGCMYLTESKFTADFLNLTVKKRNIHADLANLSMKLDLPVFDKVSLNDIIKIRYNEGESFHNFRTELSSKLLPLREITEEDELRTKLDNISFELNEVQINDVNKEYNKIVRNMGLDSAMLVGTLLTSFCTGGLTLIGAAGAAVSAGRDYTKYLSQVKDNNGFFLWKLNKEAR